MIVLIVLLSFNCNSVAENSLELLDGTGDAFPGLIEIPVEQFDDVVSPQWLVVDAQHAVVLCKLVEVISGVRGTRHDVAHYLQVGDAGVRLLPLAKQVLLVDELVDDLGGLVTIHLLHLHVHDDQAVHSILALARLLEALLDKVHCHSSIIGLFDEFIRVQIAELHLNYVYLHIKIERVVVDDQN